MTLVFAQKRLDLWIHYHGTFGDARELLVQRTHC